MSDVIPAPDHAAGRAVEAAGGSVTDGSVADLACALIAIDSSNPGLVATGAGEREIARFAQSWLADHGFQCRLVGPGERTSLIAVHTGTGGGRSLMLNGHLDTVSLEPFVGAPLTPRVENGRLHGRGAYDMKGGLAAAMVAAARVAERPHAGDIIVTLVSDEEHESAGTQEVLRHVSADAAIVLEPTDEDLVVAHRGFVWLEVQVRGRAAHGSRRDLGVDAIVAAGRFLAALGDFDAELAARTPHHLLGTGNVHASLIRGGEELSSYPEHCTISLERRTLPGETAQTVAAEVAALTQRVSGTSVSTFDVRVLLERAPFAVDVESPIVETLAAAAAKHRGRAATVRGEAFWTDCALLGQAGIPSVLYGVAGVGAHAAEEWVDLDSLGTVADTLTDAIGGFVQ